LQDSPAQQARPLPQKPPSSTQQVPPKQICRQQEQGGPLPHWQRPAKQLSLRNPGHVLLHAPQLLKSVFRSLQVVPQQVWPDRQQVVPQQVLPDVQQNVPQQVLPDEQQVTLWLSSSQHVWSLPQQPSAPVLLVQNSSPHGQMVQVSSQQYWPLGQQPPWHGVSPAGQELHALLTQYWPSAQQKPTSMIRPVTIENDG
jgi:hypothetical protein